MKLVTQFICFVNDAFEYIMAFVLVQFFFGVIEHTLLVKREKMLLLLRGTSFFVVLDVLMKSGISTCVGCDPIRHVIHGRAFLPEHYGGIPAIEQTFFHLGLIVTAN